jgi:NodT family efflux transporter outer membrane factor (OMF) lipoprotein
MKQTYKLSLTLVIISLLAPHGSMRAESETPYRTFSESELWWRRFSDTTLERLVAHSIDNNYDIAMAVRKVEMSRLSMMQAKGGYYPTLSATAGWEKQRGSAYTYARRTEVTAQNDYTLSAATSWEIDLFGKIRAKVKEEKAGWHATRAEYESTMISVAAQTAQAYLQLRMYQAELEVAQRLTASEDSVVKIAVARHECALASGLDVAQAKTSYYSTKASIPALQNSIAASINSLSLLTGISHDDLQEMMDEGEGIPRYLGNVESDIPMDLLRRRPDVMAAEYEIAGYAAALGVAEKDFLPTLSLSASIGTLAHSPKDLVKHDAMTYSITPTLTWTIFSGMTRKYAVAEAEEQMMIGIDNYNLTLLTAREEALNAISQYKHSSARGELLLMAVKESKLAYDLALDQYKQGLSEFVNVLNAQISLLNYSNELIEAEGNAQLAVIQLFQAVGGGF